MTGHRDIRGLSTEVGTSQPAGAGNLILTNPRLRRRWRQLVIIHPFIHSFIHG
jgi:hypothetical protein